MVEIAPVPLIILCAVTYATPLAIVLLRMSPRRISRTVAAVLEQALEDHRSAIERASSSLRSEIIDRLSSESGRLRAELETWRRNDRDGARAAAESLRSQLAADSAAERQETVQRSEILSRSLSEALGLGRRSQAEQLEAVQNRLEQVRETVSRQLQQIQVANEQKLEEMRLTVEEKLDGTLQKRLTTSFHQVSERLEKVHRGLGEMQRLAHGVGDLKQIMGDMRTRGAWGEAQLEALLSQSLAPEHFSKQVPLRAGKRQRVDFVVRMPGNGDEVLLPIDSKWPQAAWQRLLEAEAVAAESKVAAARKDLLRAVVAEAKRIHAKYIVPPKTTDFAVLFLPVEALYAEIVRDAELVEQLQTDYRVLAVGPTNLVALLNSLQMGFRTLAIEKRTSEVWEVLGAVKAEFSKFGVVFQKVEKKLQEART